MYISQSISSCHLSATWNYYASSTDKHTRILLWKCFSVFQLYAVTSEEAISLPVSVQTGLEIVFFISLQMAAQNAPEGAK